MVYTGNWVIEHILDFYKWLYTNSYLWYALFAVIVLYTLLLQMLYNISYLWYALFTVIVLYTLLLQMALQYLISLVCIVCCDSAIYVIFTNGFTMPLISGMHCLL